MTDLEKQKGAALIEYAEKFADKVEPKEMIELYEFYLLLKAYKWMKTENARLQELLKNKNISVDE